MDEKIKHHRGRFKMKSKKEIIKQINRESTLEKGDAYYTLDDLSKAIDLAREK